MLYDVFISHASEDKESFVRSLAEELRKNRIEVWYDEFSLTPGDSLRRSIDQGLSRSRYGLVVLSPHFFRKRWPQWELDGLVTRQMARDDKVLIPIWHGVTAEEVRQHSLPLANVIALNSAVGIPSIVSSVLDLLHPQGSSLVIARDLLLDYGIDPPVVTDDWWLGIVEASVTVFRPGKWVGVDSTWQFPLPPRDDTAKTTGKRLAWTALQLRWQKKRLEQRLCQITHPTLVEDFIASEPGLREVCIRFPRILMESAPQLVIPEFSGEFGPAFDRLLEESVQWYRNLAAGAFSEVENAASLHLPLNAREAWKIPSEALEQCLMRQSSRDFSCGSEDRCESILVLRHPLLKRINPSHTAFEFFRSELYDKVDFVAWLLSDSSAWLPERIRDVLSRGMKKWGVWPWGKHRDLDKRKDFSVSDVTGALAVALDDAESFDDLEITQAVSQDVEQRLAFSATILQLPESGTELTERFFHAGWVESWFCRDFAESHRSLKTVRMPSITKRKDDFFIA